MSDGLRRCKEKEQYVDAKLLRILFRYNPTTGVLVWKTSGKNAGYIDACGYCVVRIKGFLYRAHRIAWAYMTGEWPAGVIDHRDLNRNNNVFSNLRNTDTCTNAANSKVQANNKSGYCGVHFRKSRSKWVARVCHRRKRYTVGMNFASALEAHEARIAFMNRHGIEGTTE